MQSKKREKRQDVTMKIKKILLAQSGCKVKRMLLKFSLKDDIGIDSLSRVEFIQKIEDLFDIEIPDTDAEKLKTVRDHINCVLALQG